MKPESQSLAKAKAALLLTRSVIRFKAEGTPGGDEYARRAFKALAYLRADDIERCQQWNGLLYIR